MGMTDNAANVAMCNEALGLLGAETITVGSGTETNHVICTTFFDSSRDETLSFHKWNFAKKRAFAVETTKPIFGPDNAFTYPTDSIKIWKIEEDALAKFEVEDGLIITSRGETPQGWGTATVYVANEYVSVTPSAWATATAVIDGQYLTSGTLIYEVLVSHTTDTIANDVTAGNLISRGAGDAGTYLVAVAHTSDTVAIDVAAGNLTPAGGDTAILACEYVYQRTDVDAWPEYARRANVLNLASKIAPAIKQNEEAALNLQAMLHGSKKVTGYLDLARSIDAQEQGGVVILTNTFLNSRRGAGFV